MNMNMNCNGTCGGGGSDSLMRKLQEVEFAIYELTLYLDAYPESQEALKHYHSLMDARRSLVAEYQSKRGPLTMYGNESTSSWDWASTPWPWET